MTTATEALNDGDNSMGLAITHLLCKKLGFTAGGVDADGNVEVTTPELVGVGKFNASSSNSFGTLVLMLPLTVMAPDFTESGYWEVSSARLFSRMAGDNPHHMACSLLMVHLDEEKDLSPAFLTLLKANLAGLCTPENQEVLNAIYDAQWGKDAEEVAENAAAPADNVIALHASKELH